jgi:hypothetical protein
MHGTENNTISIGCGAIALCVRLFQSSIHPSRTKKRIYALEGKMSWSFSTQSGMSAAGSGYGYSMWGYGYGYGYG